MNDVIHAFLRILEFSIVRYFLIAGAFFTWFYLIFNKAFSVNKIQGAKVKRKAIIMEVLNSMSTTFVLTLIGLILLQSPVKFHTRVYHHFQDYSEVWFISSVIFALIIHDTYFYWMHYLLHHPRIFKYAHVTHHKSVNPTPFSSYSFHVIEAFFEGVVLLIIVMVLPIHPIAIGLFVVIAFIINVYGHLGYEIAPLWFRKTFLFEILNTSVYHNLHHRKFRGNYGLYFRFWDRIMKTEHPDYVKVYDEIQNKRTAKH